MRFHSNDREFLVQIVGRKAAYHVQDVSTGMTVEVLEVDASKAIPPGEMRRSLFGTPMIDAACRLAWIAMQSRARSDGIVRA